MSSPLILPCSAVRVGQKVSCPDSLVASLQVQGAMATMTLTGVGFPQVMLRLERDGYACKMSHPDKKGRHIVMLLDVNLVRPMQSHMSDFLGKTEEGCVFFQQLYLLFDQDSNYWSRQQYEAFVQSVKANFPGDSWGFMGAEESANAWSENKIPGEATQSVKEAIEMLAEDKDK